MILVGDVRSRLKELADCSVQCVVTSPPYWGLRDYGTATWIGGDLKCSHKRDSKFSESCSTGQRNLEGAIGDGIYKDVCPRCNAKRIDKQLGLELTPDEYVKNLVETFREIHRVLKDDGVLWLNLGDTYNNLKVGSTQKNVGAKRHNTGTFKKNMWGKLKPKDLIGIPWRVAFALQADGWYLRQDIIWHKPNPMPESVKDRCTKAHEYIFLFSKNQKYFFSAESIKEPAKYAGDNRGARTDSRRGTKMNSMNGATGMFKNKRSVWTVATKPFKEAHFATFPPDLIIPCILSGCSEGEIVLDPFFGAGTTGLVAQRHNRQWIGCELNLDYALMAKKRIEKENLETKIINTSFKKR